MTAASTLIPIDYQGFHTSEAIFDPTWMNDPLKRFRMTRKGWGEFFGAKNPQKYIDKLKERYPELPEGIPVTVTVTEDYNWQGHSTVTMTAQCPSERTREITVLSLDVWESYQYAIRSALPRAKRFLQKFPDFIKAIMTNSLSPDRTLLKIAQQEPRTLGRRQAVMQVAKDTGECQVTIYRRIRRLVEGKPIYNNCPEMRKGYIHRKHRDVAAEVIRFFAEGLKIKEIEHLTGIPDKTLYRWKNKKPL